MTRYLFRRRFLSAAFLFLTGLEAASAAIGSPDDIADRRPGPEPVLMAQGGCAAAVAQAEDRTGGRVLSVRSVQQGDRVVCVVTVLVPASDGNRPRRQTITIEQ
ncbi:hypothetical protein [Aureimonas sp. ME7]|uniref:hypothetical protein n=1 Tax=Aureimonas sp. ME7 TaxID=2744252 RepID=UPI0015F417BC|nr:hypothetical protein [Aureimonas sp. ME7]